MKVSVDPTQCGCTGYCVELVPDVFELPIDGPARVLQPLPAPELWAAVQEAETVCPTRAITVSET
jgi:ferredoxin